MVPLAPTRMSAEWSVGWPLFFGESTSPKSGDGVAVLLNVVGGAGASASGDGSDAVDVHMSNCALVPAEVVESGYMLRVERYELIQGSGGAGRYRGGLGLRADYRNISDRVMYARTEVEQTNPRFFPEGLDGGERGSGCAAALIAGDSGVETILPGKATTMLQPGDIISLRAGGGAGWGDPRDRDAALVAEDVANLKVFPGLVGSGR